MAREINKNIAWVEPNEIYSTAKFLSRNGESQDTAVYDVAPPMENFCITADLEVEIVRRGHGGVSGPTKTILVSWTSNTDGKDNISFFQGTRYKFGDKISTNYLTSDPTTFGTFDEVKKVGTNECFGINSIDIQYNSYMVPEVTIEFTDIRGISLFSPEELRHSAVNEEGTSGYVNDNVAGSFFKCFFSFPYPRFKLMIKGFYGEPTTYELTVSDFRTRFDSSTGNFNATARFVGYAYSLLNDITLNALVVAPLSEYNGKKYWENRINEGKFVFAEGTPMITISDIVTKANNLKGNLEKFSNDSVEAQKQKELSIENQKISNINTCHQYFYKNLYDHFNKFKITSDNNSINPCYTPNKKAFVFFLRDESYKDVSGTTNEIISSYSALKEAVSNYGNNLNSTLYYKDGNVVFSKLDYADNIDKIKSICPDYIAQTRFNFNDSSKWYVIIYDGRDLENQMTALKTKNENAINENEKLISDITKSIVIDVLGFNPSVENMTKLIFAHFETLIHSIYCCINEVDPSRSAVKLGISTTDVVERENIGVGPFPRVDINNVYDGVTSTEEGWMGDLYGGVTEPEVNLIEGLLKAVNVFQSVAEKAGQEILQSGNTSNYTTSMEIPITPLDIVMKGHPFGKEKSIDFNNISDIIGRIGLRLFSLFGLNSMLKDADATKIGIADAYNFYAQFPEVCKRFLERLCGESNDTLNSTLFLNCLLNRSYASTQSEKISEKWAWDGNNSNVSDSLIVLGSQSMNGNNYGILLLNLYNVSVNDNEKCKILPISNINWDNINSTILNGQIPENMQDFVSTSYVENKPQQQQEKQNYNAYGGYASKMMVDNEQFKHVSDMKLTFDLPTYLEQFYYGDGRVFRTKFNKDNSSVNYNPYKGSNYLPSQRPLNEQDAKKTESFNDSSKLDVDFFVYYYYDNNNLKNVNKTSEKTDTFSKITDVEDVSNFTLPTFRGIEYKTTFTNNWSLFGQLDYYEVNDYHARALIFLDTLKLKEEGHNMGGIRFENYSFDADKNIAKHILDKEEPFCVMPYIGLLLLGGYFWREKYINENNGTDPLGSFIHNDRRGKPYCSITYTIPNDLFNLRQEIKNILIKEFVDWVKNSSSGFEFIRSNFELSSCGGLTQYEFVKKLIEELSKNKKNVETFLFNYASDSFYANYLSVKLVQGKLKLFNRETSTALNAFTKFFMKPCMVIKPTSFILSSDGKTSLPIYNKGKTYINSFIKKLKELYTKNFEASKQVPTIVNPIKTSNHIKSSLYKYIKIIYDKWLSGTEEEVWNIDKYYKEKWYFLDSYYNNIGNRVMINVVDFVRDIIFSQENNGYSLLSFISKAFAANRFNLFCVQNFMNLNDEKAEQKFKKMFDAIPYNEIDFNNIAFHPAFILMYTYEQSSKLDIKDADYKNDSYNLDGDNDQLPPQITTKRLDNGYKLPAFAVTYGKQYQHYFKNIEISTDNPIVTEESIKAQFMIAGMNSKDSGEGGKKINFIGQDLYTIYSNNSYTCTVKMMGCAWIQPLMYFQLNNIPMFRGAYLIQKVTHHIEPGNMETTFVGVRMAKQTTRLIDDPMLQNPNDQTAPQEQELWENALANADNDCQYAFYNPNIDSTFSPMEEGELDMTLNDYETKYNVEFDKIITDKSQTVKQLLGRVVDGEARNQDRLGKQLIGVVLFNRYMYFGKNLEKLFWDSQHAIGEKNAECESIIEEIFTKSPSFLEGQVTNVKKQIPILGENGKTGNNTVPVPLTMHMLKTMDGYCTTRGYDLEGGHTCVKEKKGWWHKVEYECQHDGGPINLPYGHVFVGGFMGSKEHWQEPEKKTANSTNSSPSEAAENLFNSIKKTIGVSQKIKCDSIEMEKDIRGDRDVFYIVAKPQECMEDIFDATVNTYYDYFSECNWIVNNDVKESPLKIRIKAENNAVERTITMASLSNVGDVNNLNSYENMNQSFYKTLKKRYGVIDTNNREIFKKECKNFNTLISKDVDWMTIVNNLLNNKIESCGGEVNLPIVEGYTWDGDNSIQNGYKPSGKLSNYNPSGASTYAWANKKTSQYVKGVNGYCATYVRKAMKEGTSDKEILNTNPMSACVYTKFLPTWGFKEVYSNFGDNIEGFTPQDGDIAVVAGKLDGKEKHKHGHIQIYNLANDVWVSDYPTKKAWCYSDKGRPYIIYRWDGTSIT